jgi:predicted N-acetyltransferase YhbS
LPIDKLPIRTVRALPLAIAIKERGALVENISPCGSGQNEQPLIVPLIVPLQQIALADVEALLDAAFGPERFARTAYRMREGTQALPALSFAAQMGTRLVGTLQSWPVALRSEDGKRRPLCMVGPVAVMPDVQRGGIGRLLMAALVDAAEAQADSALMMIGDPEYYGRFFDFSAANTAQWDLPGSFEQRRLLARGANGHVPPAIAGMIEPDPARNPV